MKVLFIIWVTTAHKYDSIATIRNSNVKKVVPVSEMLFSFFFEMASECF